MPILPRTPSDSFFPLGPTSLGPALFLVASLLVSSTASAQGRGSVKVYPDVSHSADTQLRNAENHVRGGQFAPAVEIYQRVISQFGDKVVEVPNDDPTAESHLFVDVRFDCQRRIAALPPEGRAVYRARVDPQAARWFKQGVDHRDKAALRRVVDEAYCSSFGDDAQELLGDLAFQEGNFAEAISTYRRLVPTLVDPKNGLAHPDPSIDLARVAAKILMAQAALGTNPPTRADLENFAKRFPNAKGTLAGRDAAPYLTILAETLRDDQLTPAPVSDIRWPTFAGSPTRNRIAAGTLDVGSLQWQVDLEPASGPKQMISQQRFGGRRPQIGPAPPTSAERLLAYHPIIVGEQVIFCDQKQVVAYDLNQRSPLTPGIPAPPVRPAWRQPGDSGFTGSATRQYPSIPRYTLTAFGDRIYARMGPPATIQLENNFGGRGFNQPAPSTLASAIISLDRSAVGKPLKTRLASEISLPKHRVDNGEGNGTGPKTAVFEGSPLADATGVYVAITDRIEMTATYVAKLDPDTLEPKWVRYVCEANANADRFGGMSQGEISHRLLSMEGSTIYYQTNLGAVAALDSESGSIKWIATYPWEGKGGPNGESHERDLNPAVVADGLVIVAPDDSPAVFAFDELTGRLVWKSKTLPEGCHLTHLLGVAKGNVIATGDRVMLFSVKTGSLVGIWPDGGQTPEGFGRGVLAGDKIYWPTKNEIHILDQRTGLRAEPPIKLQETFGTTGGNLTVGDGYLIIAQESALVVFCQNRRLIERYRNEIALAPDQALNYYRLAQAAESAGLLDLALEHLALTLKKARPSEMIDGLPLVESTRDHQFRLFYKQGYAAKEAKNWALAESRFRSASEVARTPRDTLSARLEQGESQLRKGDPAASVRALQGILADPQLRPIVVEVADGHRSVRADLLAIDRLSEILRDHGRTPYEPFDREAREMARRGRDERDPKILDDLIKSYPLASVVPESLAAIGEIHESRNQYADAARAYKRLVALDPSDELELRGLLGLARSYEAQRLWVPARDTYTLAKNRHPEAKLGSTSETVRVVDFVGRKLAQGPFAKLGGDSVEPLVTMPLGRLYRRDWPRPLRPLAAEGVPPSTESGRIFLADGTKISPVDPVRDHPAWTFDLQNEPVWVGYLSDRIIAASRSKIVALSLDKGQVEWEFDIARAEGGKEAPNLFGKVGAGEVLRDDSPANLQDFRVVGGRVVCLRGESSLIALDGDTGQVDWTFTPDRGRINPHLMVGPSRIALQVREPNAILVLDTATGRRRGEFKQDAEEPWRRDPIAIDEDHVAVVADRRTVSLFDLNRGVNVWQFRESESQPIYGPPRLFVNGRNLLVLHDGRELISLDPANGAKRWYRPISDKDLSERPEAVRLGSDSFFFVNGSDLSAVSLKNGTTSWTRPLIGPSTGWALSLTEKHIVAYPNPARLLDPDIASWPIVIRRRQGGGLAQRLTIPAGSTDLTVKLAPNGALIATRAGLWSLIERSP